MKGKHFFGPPAEWNQFEYRGLPGPELSDEDIESAIRSALPLGELDDQEAVQELRRASVWERIQADPRAHVSREFRIGEFDLNLLGIPPAAENAPAAGADPDFF